MLYAVHSTGATGATTSDAPRTVVYLGRGSYMDGPGVVATLRTPRGATSGQWRRINAAIGRDHLARWERHAQAWTVTREALRTVLVVLGGLGIDVVLSRHADKSRAALLADAEAQLVAAYELTARYGYDYLHARYGVSLAHGDAVKLRATLPDDDLGDVCGSSAIAAFGGAA